MMSQNCLNIVEDFLKLRRAADKRAQYNFQMKSRQTCLHLLLTIKLTPALKKSGLLTFL